MLFAGRDQPGWRFYQWTSARNDGASHLPLDDAAEVLERIIECYVFLVDIDEKQVVSETFRAHFEPSDAHLALESLREFLAGVNATIPTDLLYMGVTKLVRNVNEWAHSEGEIIACVRGDDLVVRVEDRGVGILRSLEDVVGTRSAIKAVEAAFKDGVTSSGEATRGSGLFFCLGLTDKSGGILMETVGHRRVGG